MIRKKKIRKYDDGGISSLAGGIDPTTGLLLDTFSKSQQVTQLPTMNQYAGVYNQNSNLSEYNSKDSVQSIPNLDNAQKNSNPLSDIKGLLSNLSNHGDLLGVNQLLTVGNSLASMYQNNINAQEESKMRRKQFEPILSVNNSQGTGMPLYQKYGGITFQKGGKVKPIYTNDKNDPKLKAYNDSLKTYNLSEELNILSDKITPYLQKKIPYPREAKENFLNLVNKVDNYNGNVPLINDKKGWNNRIPRFLNKKPVQPVLYNNTPREKSLNLPTLPYAGGSGYIPPIQAPAPGSNLLTGPQPVPYVDGPGLDSGPGGWERRGFEIKDIPYKNGGLVKKAKRGIKVTYENPLDDPDNYNPNFVKTSNSRNNNVISTKTQANPFRMDNLYMGYYNQSTIPQQYNTVKFNEIRTPGYNTTQFNPATGNWDNTGLRSDLTQYMPSYYGNWSDADIRAFEAPIIGDNITPSIRGNRDYLNPVVPVDYFGRGGIVQSEFTEIPEFSNVLAEGGEFMQIPNGSTTSINGDKHSDPSGGEYLNLPEGTKIYSDKLKVDKNFASETLGRKVKNKMTISDLAKKFNTKKEDKVLENFNSDDISIRTAELSKNFKTKKLDDIFNYQESLKSPQSNTQFAQDGTLVDFNNWYQNQYLNPVQTTLLSPEEISNGDTYQTLNRAVEPINTNVDITTSSELDGNTPIPSRNTMTKRNKTSFKGVDSLMDYIPEFTALANATNKFPIPSQRYQPKYLSQPAEMNIQSNLNANLAATQQYINGRTGNPSIDNARALQALANLNDANNQVYQQKYNYDTQARQRVNEANINTENQANLQNLQFSQQYWDQAARRQAAKEAGVQQIANSLYSKRKGRILDNRNLELAQQAFPHYQYNPGQGGISFIQDPNNPGVFIPANLGYNNYQIPDQIVRTTNNKGKDEIKRKYNQ